jgi:diguanylate cyclase (GGDEF)-like protein
VTGRITLGLLVDQLVSGYARLLIAGMEDWCRARDANLIIFSGKVLQSPFRHEYQSNVIFDYIRKGTIDAVVIASGTQASHLSPEQFSAYVSRFEGIPKVSIGVSLNGIPSVLIDNGTGIRAAIEHLAGAHGFKRIAFLTGPDTNAEARERFEAYREAVRVHRLADDPTLVLRGDFTPTGARRALEAHLQTKGRPDFQALLAANDEMAIEAGLVLSEHGYAIPREIALVGFDNIVTSQFAVPPLTTVDQSLHDQGWTAAAFAARLARGEQVPPRIVLPPHLVPRTSCGCLPGAVVELEGLSTLPGRSAASMDVDSIVDRSLIRFAQSGFALPDKAPRNALASLIAFANRKDFDIAYYEALVEETQRGVDIAYWQGLLGALQEELIARAQSADEVTRTWARFQKARILLAELLRIQQGKKWADLLGELDALRSITERLVSVASIEELMTDLSDELHHIDIGTCFIVGYSAEIHHRRGEEWVIPEAAEMLLAHVGGERILPRPEESAFSPVVHLVPPSLLPGTRRYHLVAAAMYFREDQIGYILFEPGARDSMIYETFCVQLSSILEGARLLNARQKAEERLRQVLAELEEYNQKLSGLSQTDELTGLYNRRGFLSFGNQSLALARRMGRRGNVFFADLDGLKMINDTYGHQEGDAAIRQAASILSTTFRHMDIIARLGGDEFTILAVDTGPDFQTILRKRLEAELGTYNAQAKKPYRLSISVGAVPFDQSSTVSLGELLEQADETLYAEKKRKKESRQE